MPKKFRQEWIPFALMLIALLIPSCSNVPPARHSLKPPLDNAPIKVLALNPTMSEL